MRKMAKSLDSKKSGWVDNFVLTVFLCVLALRAMFTESPHITSFSGSQLLGNDGVSLLISSVLFFAAALWFVFVFCRRKKGWRFSGMEVWIGLFVLAGYVGVFFASNKRVAITDAVTLAGPMLMALLMTQILDRGWKIKLVLWVMAALGVVQAYQCGDQFFIANDMMIEQYEENPQAQLEQLGIKQGSFQHMSYEHRLYSKDVKGFLTTGNSAGAFFLLAIAAGGALFVGCRGREKKVKKKITIINITLFLVWIILSYFTGGIGGTALAILMLVCYLLFGEKFTYAVMAVAAAAGLIMTHSKGGIGATVLAAMMLGCYLLFGGWLRRHRVVVVTALMLSVIAAGVAVVHYGVTHGGLPGGNSILVRWQYWQGAAEMSADYPLTGVGGGNFGSYYMRYKVAAAPEVVKDPHNFLLSLLSQYGPLGLIGFIGALGAGLMRIVFGNRYEDEITTGNIDKKGNGLSAAIAGGVVITAMLIFRPFVIQMEGADGIFEVGYMIVYLYMMPAIFFAVPFLLMWASAERDRTIDSRIGAKATAAIFCGVCGVIAGNVIDFAIFEPGVLTALWVMIGCMVAMGRTSDDEKTVATSKRPVRIIVMVAVIGAWVMLMGTAFLPAIRASCLVQQASKGMRNPHDLLYKAESIDKLNPLIPNLHGKVFVQEYLATGSRNIELLKQAESNFILASELDRANFKNYTKLSEVYILLGENSSGQAKADWQTKAYEANIEALQRYPGSDRIQFDSAKIADSLGDTDKAISHYTKAVEIEDAYRKQFEVMYPGREKFSRLGEDKYAFAKTRIDELKKQGNRSR